MLLRILRRSFTAYRQSFDADRGRGYGAAEFKVIGDLGDVEEEFFQISGDRDFFYGVGEFSIFNPLAGGAAGVVPGDQVHTLTQEFRYVEALLDSGDQLFRSLWAGLQEIVSRTDARSPR